MSSEPALLPCLYERPAVAPSVETQHADVTRACGEGDTSSRPVNLDIKTNLILNLSQVKNLALMAYISVGCPSGPIMEFLEEWTMEKLEEIRPAIIPASTKIFVNGVWVGIHRDPTLLVNTLRQLRRQVDINTEVCLPDAATVADASHPCCSYAPALPQVLYSCSGIPRTRMAGLGPCYHFSTPLHVTKPTIAAGTN